MDARKMLYRSGQPGGLMTRKMAPVAVVVGWMRMTARPGRRHPGNPPQSCHRTELCLRPPGMATTAPIDFLTFLPSPPCSVLDLRSSQIHCRTIFTPAFPLWAIVKRLSPDGFGHDNSRSDTRFAIRHLLLDSVTAHKLICSKTRYKTPPAPDDPENLMTSRAWRRTLRQ